MTNSNRVKLLLTPCLLLMCVLTADASAKLNVPKVLLPYHTEPFTHFTLAASDGCYVWESSRPDVAKVEAISQDGESTTCSSHALVTSVSTQPQEATSIVMAREQTTGAVLRCDVIVNRIHSISILTTTRHLYLEDAPEVFDLFAYDEEGNAFSSLDGIEFQWTLLPDSRVEGRASQDPAKVLRFLKFADSDYDTHKHIHDMELRSSHGSSCLVEGIKTGTAVVQAKLKDARYASVAPVSATLIVVANLVLDPSVNSYVLVNGLIPYRVKQIRQNSIEDIAMPSRQYFLSVADTEICSLEERTSLVAGVKKGHTLVVLQDRDVSPTNARNFMQPQARIYVVDPHHLGFLIDPHNSWVLESRRKYTVTIQVFDSDNHLIYASPNLRIKATFPEKHFRVLSSSENGATHVVETLEPGTDHIRATLDEIIPRGSLRAFALEPPISGDQEFEIFHPITLVPKLLVFPWLPSSSGDPVSYRYKLIASGGSGHYAWKSSRSEVAMVDSHGVVVTRNEGVVEVTAADVRNKHHSASSKILVLPPKKLSFLPSPVEAEIGKELTLPLRLDVELPGSKELVPITDCRGLPFHITSGDSSIFEHVPDASGSTVNSSDACVGVGVKAAGVQGFTQIAAFLAVSRDIQMTAEATVGAFKPLVPIWPHPLGLVTLGSSLEVAFSGGPLPWTLDPSHHFQIPIAADGKEKTVILGFAEKGRKKTNRGSKILHVFRVTCRLLSETKVGIRIGNRATPSNPHPAAVEADLPFVCAQPVLLQLSPEIPKPSDLPVPCPLHADDAASIPVRSSGVLDLIVGVTDAKGRRFHNFSSLNFEWSLSRSEMAELPNPPALKTVALKTADGVTALSSSIGLRLFDAVGDLRVDATVASYLKDHLALISPAFEPEVAPPISDHVTLQLVGEPKLSPESITLFNHPSNKATLEILGGSGFFHVTPSDGSLAELEYDIVKPREVVATPSRDGDLVVTVHDLCVEGGATASAKLHIAGLHSIELSVLDKVELSHTIEASVIVLDTRGVALPSSLHKIMGLQPVLHDAGEFISLSESSFNLDGITATYVVTGASIGHTSLAFTAYESRSGGLVSSVTKPIQVFPPLRLSPKNITLIIGAEFQVLAVGGPQPESTVRYFLSDGRVASVSSNGLVSAAAIGESRLVGKAVGVDPVTGKEIVYSEDYVNVFVVRLSGLRIHAPLRRLKVGNTMPLFAVGVSSDAESPHAFGSASPALRFQWSINSKQIAFLHAPIHERRIVFPSESDFARRLKALEPGHVKVTLKAAVVDGSKDQVESNRVLQDSIEIQIFDDLTLLSPPKLDGQLLMTPNTEMPVKTSRDGAAGAMSYKILGPCGQAGVAIISRDGVLKSGNTQGTATLQITAHESFGINQTLAILVRVAPIAYLMLNSATVVHSTAIVHAVPVGLGLELFATYHDSVGDVFDAVDAALQKRPNRFDLLEISTSTNHSLSARANRVGRSVVKVWMKSSHAAIDAKSLVAADFVPIFVDDVIAPRVDGGVVVGDVLCFSSSLSTSSETPGVWGLAEGGAGALSLDGSGLGVAIKAGASTVRYYVGANQYTLTDVHVAPLSAVGLASVGPETPALNNFAANSVVVDAVLRDDSERHPSLRGALTSECRSALERISVPAPFRCRATLAANPALTDALISVAASFDAASGFHRCVVTSKLVTAGALLESASRIDSDVFVTAIATTLGGIDLVSNSVAIPYSAPFYVTTPTEDPLVLASDSASPLVVTLSTTLSSAAWVEASSSHPSLLSIEKEATSAINLTQEPTRILVSLTNPAAVVEDVVSQILIQSSLTGQKVSVPLHIKFVESSSRAECPSAEAPLSPGAQRPGLLLELISFILSYYQTIFVVLLTVLATIGAVFVANSILMRRPPASAHPAFLGGSALTPSPRNPPGAGDSPSSLSPMYAWRSPTSPRPQPQLWSTDYNVRDSAAPQPASRSFTHSPPRS